MPMFTDYRDHVGASPEKFFKSTLFQSEQLLLGLNCLEPGQEQHVHTPRGGKHPVLASRTMYVDDPDGNEVEFICAAPAE